ncbi:MAG: hypothetical protein QOF76_3883, partial [Solirubrobacteraceae bacterium]|nr:hypothetical protein [Solirubrobacteraceae bacterium]
MFRHAPLRLPTGEAHENGTQGFGRGTTGYVSLAVKTAERLTRVTCALALLASLALSRVAAAGETTSYQGNPAHDGTVAGETLQPPLSVRWQRQLGGEAKPSMVVADGIVAVITPATASGPEPLSLTVLDQADGHVLWTATARADADEASVAYADHTLYFADEYGSVTAFSDKTGAVKWTAAGEGLFYWGPITVADGLVFLTRDDSGGDVYVLDAATGQP